MRHTALRRGGLRRWFAMVGALTLAAPMVGCVREPAATVRVDPCRDLIDRAALAREVDQQLSLLDAALVVCRDLETFSDGLRLHPGAIGVAPATFAERRCADPPDQMVARSSICLTVLPEGPAPVGEGAQVQIYVGITLDGRRVELRSDRVAFTEGRPAGIVEVVEVGTRRGCEGLSELYRRWIPLVGLEDRGDELSVYAQHTLNVMASQGCTPPDPPGDDDREDGTESGEEDEDQAEGTPSG